MCVFWWLVKSFWGFGKLLVNFEIPFTLLNIRPSKASKRMMFFVGGVYVSSAI